MNELRLLALLTLLSGCATPPVVYKPVRVEVPVSVPCQAPVVLHPEWPTRSIAPDADIFTQSKALLAEIELRAGYEGQLEAGLKSCQ